MNKLKKISALIRKALTAFFLYFFSDEKCAVCGTNAPFSLCFSCSVQLRKNIVYDVQKRCKKCGRLLLGENEVCTECRENEVLYADGCFSFFSYRLWAKNMLFMWKMQEKRAMGYFFSSCINEFLNQKFNKHNMPVIVPVPPRPHKIKRKGWDQIDDLCRFLNSLYGFKIFRALYRSSENQQKKLGRKERFAFASSSYHLNKKVPSKCKVLPREAVLIDDVFTTGSTVRECASLLKTCGIPKVYALTIFIVD